MLDEDWILYGDMTVVLPIQNCRTILIDEVSEVTVLNWHIWVTGCDQGGSGFELSINVIISNLSFEFQDLNLNYWTNCCGLRSLDSPPFVQCDWDRLLDCTTMSMGSRLHCQILMFNLDENPLIGFIEGQIHISQQKSLVLWMIWHTFQWLSIESKISERVN